MEQSLRPIGLSWSAHRQASGGLGTMPQKKKLARLAHCGTDFCNLGFMVGAVAIFHVSKNIVAALCIIS